MQSIKIGLLGFGTVGRGAYNVLRRNQQEITRRAGRGIEVAAIAVRSAEKARAVVGDAVPVVTDPALVIARDDIDIVVELIGGYGIAKELVLRAIEHGKHVVTANKALLAVHGNEIFAAASRKGVMVAFEAAVAGGIPIIKAIREGLSANRIEWVAGIINGTGNYILSEMREKGRPFSEALAAAQRLGYAEADPSFDVDGIDAAHKLVILASLAFGIPLQFEKVYTEGISALSLEDLAYAEDLGYRIKHLGICRRTREGIELRVHPTLIPDDRLIANVNGVMNAVLVMGDAVGPTLYYGAGAGSLPTASAVVADVIDVARVLTTDPENRVPHLAFQPGELSDLPVLPMAEIETAYYLRFQCEDRPGVLAAITGILGEAGISIEAVKQKEPAEGETHVPLVMLTHRVVEKQMNAAIGRIEALSSVRGPVVRIRMEHLA